MPTDSFPTATVLSLDSLTPAAPRWLWPGRIPIGALTLITGDPGTGKSILALDIAARLTASLPWPDAPRSRAIPSPHSRRAARPEPAERACPEPAEGVAPASSPNASLPPLELSRPPADVLYLGAEDDLASVTLPRLRAAGGDPSRFFALRGIPSPGAADADAESAPLHLARDYPALRDAIRACRNPALLLIDPLFAHLPLCMSPDAFRAAVNRLARLANEFSLAVLAICHLNKQSATRALYRSAGSHVVVAAARCVHLVAPDPDADSADDLETPISRALFLNLKNNLAPAAGGLSFSLSDNRVHWDPHAPVPASPQRALTPRSTPRLQRQRLLRQASDFLTELLADTPQRAQCVFKAASDRALSIWFIRQAATDLGVIFQRLGNGGHTLWRLPTTPNVPPPSGSESFNFSDLLTDFEFGPPKVTPSPTRSRTPTP
jgi:hypothetical protein